MSDTSAIGGMNTSFGSVGAGNVGLSAQNDDKENSKKVAYAGPNIGNILNGSATHPGACAVRA